jgi:hypothetical protein
MLVVSDRSQLGDKYLDAAENLAKLKEDNAKLTAKQKLPDQDELENAERAWGPQIPYQELIRKIRRLNPAILVVDGSEGNIAIYAPKNRHELIESENNDLTSHSWHKAHKYVSGCPKKSLPEYSTILTDERGRMTRELRGWRSVLIALVKSKAITYRQAVEEFGNPETDQRSGRWFQQLKQYMQ